MDRLVSEAVAGVILQKTFSQVFRKRKHLCRSLFFNKITDLTGA